MTPERAIDLALACVHDLFGLTRAEVAILRAALRGATHAQIALERGVKPETVKSQASVVCLKVSARTLGIAALGVALDAVAIASGGRGSGARADRGAHDAPKANARPPELKGGRRPARRERP